MNTPKFLKGKKAPVKTRAQKPLAGAEEGESTPQLLSDREKRLRALKLMFGAWKGRTDIPNDGLVFQEELRSE